MLQAILAIIVVVAFIGVIGLWTFFPPQGAEPQQVTAMLNTLIGLLGGSAGAVIGFYFGSSKGSSTKDDTIAALSKEPAPPTPPANPAT